MVKRYRKSRGRKLFRKKRRRTFGKKRRRRKLLPLGGFPKRMAVRLKYVQNFSLDATSGAGAIQVFRANSLYDPDYTSTGGQPSNRDKIATLFDRYTVVGAKLKLYVNYLSSSTVTPAPRLVIHLSEAGTDLATVYAAGGIENVLEQPRITRNVRYLTIPNGSKPHVYTKTFSAKKFFGVRNIVGVEPYTADIDNNPAEGAFFEVGAFSPDGSVNPASVAFTAEIEYIAVMTEPKYTDHS